MHKKVILVISSVFLVFALANLNIFSQDQTESGTSKIIKEYQCPYDQDDCRNRNHAQCGNYREKRYGKHGCGCC